MNKSLSRIMLQGWPLKINNKGIFKDKTYWKLIDVHFHLLFSLQTIPMVQWDICMETNISQNNLNPKLLLSGRWGRRSDFPYWPEATQLSMKFLPAPTVVGISNFRNRKN